MQHDRAVLADRVEHHELLGLRDRLAHDVDRLRLEALEVRQCAHRPAGAVTFVIPAQAGIQVPLLKRVNGRTGRNLRELRKIINDHLQGHSAGQPRGPSAIEP